MKSKLIFNSIYNLRKELDEWRHGKDSLKYWWIYQRMNYRDLNNFTEYAWNVLPFIFSNIYYLRIISSFSVVPPDNIKTCLDNLCITERMSQLYPGLPLKIITILSFIYNILRLKCMYFKRIVWSTFLWHTASFFLNTA